MASTVSAVRVLVLDGVDDSRCALAQQLQRAGYEVTLSAQVSEALNSVLSNAPDVVLCRLAPERRHGFELLEALQAQHVDVPVILLSTGGDMNEVITALRGGAADYLVEPGLEHDELCHAITREAASMRVRRDKARDGRELETAHVHLSEYLEELRRDQRAGRQVQKGMLPPSPMAVHGYRLQQRIFPSLFLSGDFVDYFLVTDRHLVFYIADVSGHGASSAFVTVLLKNFSRRLRREYRPQMLLQPGEMLHWMNQELLENRLDRHVVMFLGVVDTRENTLRYANAGHFPAPLLVAEDRGELLELKGKPLGIFPDEQFESAERRLPPTFALALFSDGVLDVLAEGSLSERERRLTDAVTAAGSNMERVCHTLGLEDGMEAPDDIALLLISKVQSDEPR